ncbi:16S rRNA (cytosine(967)-C(5))-methyltransferase RsmB [Glaciecola petra]|uniref:16S rRNA (cytosine(967)-C(5))-methyltransferase n=1 Tax=Glaciecola petra TaxID=3075602 RepID=A0ABU2ZRB4_9ALTE|nr:16S rRNA (cytosine(967)-C(5))-methyltransferase RsmB [Aestuariibacter sp. P117]MDT0594791.1 16S rRNA (cytosine(967)-C(5))-methyltransferase RsmB [Aestuariibacter sp. P117]
MRELTLRHANDLRCDAAWVLFQILENGHSARELMPIVWQRHPDPKNRAWLQEMIYGSLRTLPKLQFWLRQILDKPLKKKQKIIEHLIMLGLYQLTHTRTAEHAAVSETVNACKKLKEERLAGLVNAVLRRFQREGLAKQPIGQAHIDLGVPKWLYKLIATRHPDDAENIIKNMQKRADIWLRVNTLQIDLKDYLALLSASAYDFEQGLGHAIKLSKPGDITLLPGYNEGLFAIQDQAAQQAARLLQPKVGDTVLDCCAAPGGKTAAIIEWQPKLKALYALDLHNDRVEKIHENLLRLRHLPANENMVKIITGDALELSENPYLPEFDKILLDAPCSATGVIRRHPDIMWLRKPQDIEVLVDIQAKILQQAWQKLKVGGELLYATCSILPQENQQQIENFLNKNADASLTSVETNNGEIVDYWQILPGQENMDGFFYARLLKC